jgi:hypothetical protein
MSDFTTEIETLRIIYTEIISGWTFSENKHIFVKHLNELENGELARKRHSLFLKFKKEGLQTEAEKLQQMIATEAWSKDKEEEILQCRYIITDNEKMLPKIIPAQQSSIQRAIETEKKKLNNLLIEKHGLMGATAEEYAEKESAQYLLYLTLYKDSEFKQKVFPSLSDIDILEEEEISEYMDIVDESFRKYKEEIIKKVAIMPFFINYYSNCKESVHTFLGRPIISLTTYQLLLFSLGSRNLNILSNSEGQPPEMLGDVPLDDITKWFDAQYSIILGRRNTVK